MSVFTTPSAAKMAFLPSETLESLDGILNPAEGVSNGNVPQDSNGHYQRIVRSTWNELVEIDATEVPMLLNGLLPNNEIAILAGTSGLGKSTIARQLACAIAREMTRSWAGP